MSDRTALQGVAGFLEHIACVIAGFVMMVVGLGLGVTLVMLPFGLVIGLAGIGLFVCGLLVCFKPAKEFRS